MSIGMMIICAIGGLSGALSAGYLLISMPAVIIWKIYRCIKYGYNMYQCKRQIIGVYKRSTACDILQSELLDN